VNHPLDVCDDVCEPLAAFGDATINERFEDIDRDDDDQGNEASKASSSKVER
jgi:hypothetical protein